MLCAGRTDDRTTNTGLMALGVLSTASMASVLFALPLAFAGSGPGMAVLVVIFGFPIWLAGVAVLGLPGWWIMGRLGCRSRRAAALVGAAAPLIWTFGLSLIEPARLWDWPVLAVSGYMALVGAAAAAIGWGAAYRPIQAAAPLRGARG